MIREIIKSHKTFWSDKQFLFGVGLGVVLFTAGLFATYYANNYAATRASNTVTDLILDNIPVVDVNFVFTDGAAIFSIIVAIIVLYEPRRLPFALKSLALFLLVRSVFLTLTHLAPPIEQSYLDASDFFYRLSSGDDLFFSAHTGLPFLFAFMFWDERYIRDLFLAFTVIGGASVLLGHLHYSIDVFSALFIAFGIFHIAKYFFPKDYALLRGAAREPLL